MDVTVRFTVAGMSYQDLARAAAEKATEFFGEDEYEIELVDARVIAQTNSGSMTFWEGTVHARRSE